MTRDATPPRLMLGRNDRRAMCSELQVVCLRTVHSAFSGTQPVKSQTNALFCRSARAFKRTLLPLSALGSADVGTRRVT
jgi:hypothetical protein